MTKTKVKSNLKSKLTEDLNDFGKKKEKGEIVKNPSKKKKKQKEKTPSFDLFNKWEEKEFIPTDFELEVFVDSLESNVGYSSLFRQFHQSFIRQVAFNRTPAGGSLSIEEARAEAFHACTNKEEAEKILNTLMRLPVENLSFVDISELYSFAPRVAESFWEYVKDEARKEFESGHLAANISFPEGYMKGVWNIARYIGVRESFIDEWNPKGGIELSLIEMMAQSWFQWQYWMEQTIKRSETKERIEHPEYSKWMAQRERENRANGWMSGFWFRPYVTEVQAIEHAVKMADRFNRIFMRTLRQLRDLRRYSVTINNANQVNIANDGGKQVNVKD